MSAAAKYKTIFTDQDLLQSALEECFGKTAVKITTGVAVKGYSSDARPTVLIEIPGMYRTVGFCKNSEGVYELVYDTMDEHLITKCLPNKDKNGVVHHPLAQAYSKAKVIAMMRKMRGTMVQNDVDNNDVARIRIRTVSYG